MQVKRPVRNSQVENYSPARQGSSSWQLLFKALYFFQDQNRLIFTMINKLEFATNPSVDAQAICKIDKPLFGYIYPVICTPLTIYP